MSCQTVAHERQHILSHWLPLGCCYYSLSAQEWACCRSWCLLDAFCHVWLYYRAAGCWCYWSVQASAVAEWGKLPYTDALNNALGQLTCFMGFPWLTLVLWGQSWKMFLKRSITHQTSAFYSLFIYFIIKWTHCVECYFYFNASVCQNQGDFIYFSKSLGRNGRKEGKNRKRKLLKVD